jgi:3-dehydroquinate synthase
MESVRVNLGPRSYDIRFAGESGSLADFVRFSVPRARRALVVADANTLPHAERVRDAIRAIGIQSELALVPSGEATKSLAHFGQLLDALADLPADRQTPVFAVGGGVVGDLAGFAAASYNRGLPLVMVPTTLLSMVDSSVGGKTGINHAKGKNLIGAFHQPAGVWIDPAFLDTLPEREFRSGLAEVVKYGVIQDAAFFEWQEANAQLILSREKGAIEHLVARSCRLKADVVEQDEREETGLRAILNYGHTFAHAFETLGGYGTWLHGEAVSAGMVCASRLAERLGRIEEGITRRQLKLLSEFGLPVKPKAEWPVEPMIEIMRRDKKASAGKLRFVLPTKLGHVELVDGVSEDLVREILG